MTIVLNNVPGYRIRLIDIDTQSGKTRYTPSFFICIMEGNYKVISLCGGRIFIYENI